MTQTEALNILVKSSGVDTNSISDGYHTFGELYNYRIQLYISLCKLLNFHEAQSYKVWKSQFHEDGGEIPGWFVLGVTKRKGNHVISYHLPVSKWNDCYFASTLERGEYDGHTSDDVLERLKSWI